ncbi:MAG: cyclophilin family peptidyl-prolyl cis-trans isomerase [Verrucomicrobiales bacterium]|jgi:cyclophilin family peptidyl-prolyl cis-trans isomerase
MNFRKLVRLYTGVASLLFLTMPVAMSALIAPADVDWISDSNSSVIFSWSNVEQESQVEFQQFTVNRWNTLGSTKSGTTTLRWTQVESGARFRIRSVELDADNRVVDSSEYTEAIEVTLRDDLKISDQKCVIEPPGEFNYPLELTGFTLEDISLSGVPDTLGLQVEPARITGQITGGVYNFAIVGRTGNHQRTVNLQVIITTPPAIDSPIGDMTVEPTQSDRLFDLNAVFSDLDSNTVVRMQTVAGEFDIALADTLAPVTVANFLSYVDSGTWDGTFFHNVVSESFSILQGGQFRTREDGKLQRSPRDPSLSNEFDASASNVCGTIAMLKPTGDDSTNQWLFNFDDNSLALDRFYGAFGRVMGTGMSVIDTISALPSTSLYTATIVSCEGTPPNETCEEASQRLQDWPLLRIREEGLDTDDLVTITSVSRISPLTYSVDSNSSPDVASAVVSDAGELTIDFLAAGATTVTVVATDRDGASTPHSFTVSVGGSFDSWANAAGLVGDDALLTANPDGDALTNLLEYAFGGSPLIDDSGAAGVSTARQGSFEEQQVPSITFFYRADAADLDYAVQLSSNLEGEWTEVWTSAQGLEAPTVLSNEDAGGGIRKVTVSARVALLPAYLRVKVTAR